MSAQNPYEAPRVDVNLSAGADDPAMLKNASLGARFLNWLIDDVVVIVFGSVAVAVMMLLGGENTASDALGNVVAIAVMVGYYVVFEAAFGWTIGKLITGTRVKRVDGGKPRVLQIIGRTAARFIPFEPFSLLGGANVGWHDSMSGTRVVRVRR
jgi:uncharacterized RDD family membrane protein YckC